MKIIQRLMALLIFITISSFAWPHSPGKQAKVYFKNLKNGDTISTPYKVEFGIEGYGIVPAGTKDKRRHTAGHHHLLVDVEDMPDLDEPIPADARHLHFDQGETEMTLDLPPGKHTLQLLLGDEDHEPTDPPLISDKITITVE